MARSGWRRSDRNGDRQSGIVTRRQGGVLTMRRTPVRGHTAGFCAMASLQPGFVPSPL
jgi:hypothetical protein